MKEATNCSSEIQGEEIKGDDYSEIAKVNSCEYEKNIVLKRKNLFDRDGSNFPQTRHSRTVQDAEKKEKIVNNKNEEINHFKPQSDGRVPPFFEKQIISKGKNLFNSDNTGCVTRAIRFCVTLSLEIKVIACIKI